MRFAGKEKRLEHAGQWLPRTSVADPCVSLIVTTCITLMMGFLYVLLKFQHYSCCVFFCFVFLPSYSSRSCFYVHLNYFAGWVTVPCGQREFRIPSGRAYSSCMLWTRRSDRVVLIHFSHRFSVNEILVVHHVLYNTWTLTCGRNVWWKLSDCFYLINILWISHSFCLELEVNFLLITKCILMFPNLCFFFPSNRSRWWCGSCCPSHYLHVLWV